MKLENVVKIYNTKLGEVKALNSVNCEFEMGKFYAIMGSSGSGKSTLISILGLMENLTEGKYLINKKNIQGLNDEELSLLRLKNIGFVFQDFFLDEYLTSLENVMLPMIINPNIKKEDKRIRAISLLEKLGLKERLEHYPKELSGGEKQRVALARALANNPDYILADEPTGNLDEENELKIFEEFKKLSQEGKCIIVVSHSKTIEKFADEILKISKRKVEFSK